MKKNLDPESAHIDAQATEHYWLGKLRMAKVDLREGRTTQTEYDRIDAQYQASRAQTYQAFLNLQRAREEAAQKGETLPAGQYKRWATTGGIVGLLLALLVVWFIATQVAR